MSLFWDNPTSRGRKNASTVTEQKDASLATDEEDRDAIVTRLKAEKTQKMVKELRELREQLAQSVPRTEFDAMKRELDQLKLESIESEETRRELEEDMSASNVELHKANQKIKQLTDALKQAKKSGPSHQIDQLEFKLDEAEKTNRALRTALQESRQSERDAIEAEFQGRINKLTLRLQEQSNTNQQLQLSYQQLQQKYDAELTNQQNSVSVLRQQIQEQSRRHKAELANLREQQDQERAEWLSGGKERSYSVTGSDQELQRAMANLEKQHSAIEADLAKQIDDLKTAMDARERQSQEVIDEVTTQWQQYRRMAETQIDEFKKRIASFEDGNVEILLTIQVDGEDFVYEDEYVRQFSDGTLIDEDNRSIVSGRSGMGGARRPPSRPPPGMGGPPGFLTSHSRQASVTSINSAQSGYNRPFTPNQLHPRITSQRSVPVVPADDSWSATIKSKLFNAFAPSAPTGYPAPQNGVVAFVDQQREHSRRTPRHSPNASIGSQHSLVSHHSHRSIGARSMRSMRSAGPPIRHKSPSPYDARSVHSDIQRIQTVEDGSNRLQIMMYRRENAKLAEDVKMAQQQLSIITERAKAKYQQLQTAFETERRKLEDQANQAKARVQAQTQRMHELEGGIREKEAALFQAQQMNQQIQRELASREVQGSSNRSLVNQVNMYQSQIEQMKRELYETKSARKDLEQHLGALKNENHTLRQHRMTGRTGSERSPSLSSNGDSELMEQQVKVLKNQRRVLVKEVRELREQNERLKNMIVAGGPVAVS